MFKYYWWWWIWCTLQCERKLYECLIVIDDDGYDATYCEWESYEGLNAIRMMLDMMQSIL